MRDVKGFDEAAFIAAHQQLAVTSVRLNLFKPAPVFETAQSVPWCKEGRYLDARPSFTLDPYFHGGAYYVYTGREYDPLGMHEYLGDQ